MAEGLTLTEKDIPRLLRQLKKHASKWREIGVNLEFLPGELSNIAAHPNLSEGAPVSFLGALLEEWMQWAPGDSRHSIDFATFESLKTALSDSGLGAAAHDLVVRMQEPTLRAGLRLTEKHITRLLRQLKKHASKWREIGINLEFLPGELANIAARPNLSEGAPVSLLGALLEEWIQWAPGDSRGSTDFATLESLKTALSDSGLGVAAHDLVVRIQEPRLGAGLKSDNDGSGSTYLSSPPSKRIKLETPTIDDCAEKPPTIDDCAEKLSQFYLSLRTASNTWPPLKLMNFVQLALVQQDERAQHIRLKTVRKDIDEVYGKKTNISFDDLFKGVNHGSLFLLEGRPGSGKTTLMLNISCEWGNKEILTEAKVVILVHLRQLSQTGDIYLSQLLEASCNHLSSAEMQCIRSYIERYCGENVVFLLDGYDEYYYSMSEHNIVKKIVMKEMFTKSVVVVSSRPAATVNFRKTATKYVEVVGFFKEQIFQYINTFFGNNEKASSLIHHLESHPNLLNVCYLPLHCAMLVFLAQEESNLPKTETEFYRLFTLAWMFRCSHKTVEHPTSLESFDDLKAEDKLQLNNVCHLAFCATLESKQVFTAKEVKDIYKIQISSQPGMQCGLEMLVTDRVFVLTGRRETYSFFHLTMQEFLAARHMYLCILKDHEKVVDIIKRNSGGDRLSVTLRFLCGMMDYSNPATKSIFDSILKATSSNHLFHIHCAYEFQCPLSCTHVFNFHNRSFSLSNLVSSDSASLTYFLENSRYDNIKIKISSCLFDVREYEALLLAFGDRQISLELKRVNLLPLMRAVMNVGFPGLTEIGLIYCFTDVSNDINPIPHESSDDGSYTSLFTEWLKQCSKLKEITFTSIECYDVFKCLKLSCSNLESLTFNGCDFDDDTTECLKDCSKLKSLTFIDCVIMESIFKCLKYCCSKLESLKICGEGAECILDNSTWQVLGETLQNCSRLQHLDLSWTELDDSRVAHIAKGAAGCKELKELNLSDNSICDDGVKVLVEVLLVNCKDVKDINLRWNSIRDDGVKVLVEALLVNCKDVKDINVDGNSLTDDSVPCLIELIKSSKALEKLVLVEEIIGDDWDNNFTPRGWSKMVEAIESRMQDRSKLELVGEPLAFSDDKSDESSEQTDSENEISDGERINR